MSSFLHYLRQAHDQYHTQKSRSISKLSTVIPITEHKRTYIPWTFAPASITMSTNPTISDTRRRLEDARKSRNVLMVNADHVMYIDFAQARRGDEDCPPADAFAVEGLGVGSVAVILSSEAAIIAHLAPPAQQDRHGNFHSSTKYAFHSMPAARREYELHNDKFQDKPEAYLIFAIDDSSITSRPITGASWSPMQISAMRSTIRGLGLKNYKDCRYSPAASLEPRFGRPMGTVFLDASVKPPKLFFEYEEVTHRETWRELSPLAPATARRGKELEPPRSGLAPSYRERERDQSRSSFAPPDRDAGRYPSVTGGASASRALLRSSASPAPDAGPSTSKRSTPSPVRRWDDKWNKIKGEDCFFVWDGFSKAHSSTEKIPWNVWICVRASRQDPEVKGWYYYDAFARHPREPRTEDPDFMRPSPY